MDGLMGGLKEYASVVTAAVSVIAALTVLGLWAINAQVTPEIKRVDGRMENYETQYTELKDRLGRTDQRLERRLDRIDNRFIQIDGGSARSTSGSARSTAGLSRLTAGLSSWRVESTRGSMAWPRP